MKTAIMQPYIFPYIGYFQLIRDVDNFVFYDDVNFIKQGWINRNKLLISGKENYFTIPISQASSFKQINEIEVHSQIFAKWEKKFFRSTEQSYKKAPFFKDVYSLLHDVFNKQENISALAIESIIKVLDYLDIRRKIYISSKNFPETKELDRGDRIISITKKLKSNRYVNLSGGKKLYNKEDFSARSITLEFLEPEFTAYEQGIEGFLPGLSIIDVLMHNDPAEVKKMLDNYSKL